MSDPTDVNPENIYGRMQMLEGNSMVELFTVDYTAMGGDVLRFHKHLQQGVIYWQNQEFQPWPVEAEGFAKTSEQPPTPKLTVANINGSITELCRLFEDLVGAKVTRQRTFVRYLDPENWPGATLSIDTVPVAYLGDWGYSGGGLPDPQVVYRGGGVTGHAVVDIPVLENSKTYKVHMEVTNFSGDDIAVYTQTSLGGIQIGTINGNGGFNFTFTTHASNLYTGFLMFEGASFVDPGEAEIGFFTLQEIIGNPDADDTMEFPPEIWYLERKSTETREAVAFELVSAMDLNGVMLPRRQIIANYCSALSNGGYRGPYCGYTGPAVAKADDTPTSDLALDRCGGKLSSCRLRQWPGDVLNFNGFPAAGLVR